MFYMCFSVCHFVFAKIEYITFGPYLFVLWKGAEQFQCKCYSLIILHAIQI
jgi:hypothetical protein